MKLSREEVRHLAQLVHLGLSNEEVERLREQLSNILENFEVLQQVDTTGVEPTAHCIALENVLRDDVAAPSLSAGQVLANAPDREEDYLKVRAVLEQ
jgi:aspartyl-tRNA(Asn)/glutamyl-tRNA(Gln) amidotransferase subunit C